jgi:hypothetical protein
MKKYRVTIGYTSFREVEVEAANEKEANQIALSMPNDGNYRKTEEDVVFTEEV